MHCLLKWHQTFMNLNNVAFLLFHRAFFNQTVFFIFLLDLINMSNTSSWLSSSVLLFPFNGSDISSPTTQLSTDSDHYCATQFLLSSSLTSSDKLYLSLSHSVLPLLFSPGAPEGYKCSSASLQYQLIPNLAARRSEGENRHKNTQFAKTSRGMQNKIVLSQKHL